MRGDKRGFATGIHHHPEWELVSAATTGLRFQKFGDGLPQEFVCSAVPEQSHEAGYLVHVVAESCIRRERGLAYGSGYLNDGPLIPETEIVGALAMPHPLAEQGFDVLRDADGEATLKFMTLMPVTEDEFRFIQAEGPQEMVATWSREDVDVFDFYRDSAV
ncbi:suppressor of fused domain protein [Spirillospora sp. NPDC047279]|uniref:suppressor of fused domain protein n=1 Tax=Spirillospora sp. NPDC047279 TaxID=3155478 RepID=UPI0033EBA8B4